MKTARSEVLSEETDLRWADELPALTDDETWPFQLLQNQREIIRLAVMLYIRFPLSLRNVEDLLHKRGLDVSY